MRKVDASLGFILRSGKIPAKGTVNALYGLIQGEKKKHHDYSQVLDVPSQKGR